jgi:hypothetical protein
MNEEQFLEALSKTPRRWFISKYGMIRCIPDEPDAENCMCPISALRGMSTNCWGGIAKALELPRELKGKIIITSDAEAALYPDAPDRVFLPEEFSISLRVKMLKACGLS